MLTTRELIWMIKCYGINFTSFADGEFDAPLGLASGAGDIFGTTGGVMEATLRAASELVTGKPADRLEFTEVRAVEGLRETYVAIGETTIHVGVANGLTNAKLLLDKVYGGEEPFHVIEVMACPGGCIGGGGQPYPPEGIKVLDPELLRKRASALYSIDSGKKLRKCYENPAIEEVYDKFLGGPGSAKAHELLHTPLPRRKTAPRHPMSTTSTDNWDEVAATARPVLGEPIGGYIEQCRQGPNRTAIDFRSAPGAGPFRLPGAAQFDAVAQLLQVPAAKVAGVASFYHFFRLQPRGRFIINVCLGTACYVKGADRVAQKADGRVGHHLGRNQQGRHVHAGSLPLPGHLRPGPGGHDRRRGPPHGHARPGPGDSGKVHQEGESG